MTPDQMPFLTHEALALIRLALDGASTPENFFLEVDWILQDPRLTAGGTAESWPELTVSQHGDGGNAVALWRHTTSATGGLTRSQATDGRLWTCLALSRYRDYMHARWPLETTGASNWKNRVRDRWVMPVEPTHKPALRHGIARLWWIPCLTSDDHTDDMALTRWVLSEERLVIDLLDRFVTMSAPTRYAVLELMVRTHEQLPTDRRRRFMVELNNVAGVRDLDSMSAHDRDALLRELVEKV